MSYKILPTTLAIAAVAIAACAESDAQFSIQYAPGFTRGGSSVSVFGVYKDGRVNAEAWDALGPGMSAPLGKASCETAYSNDLLASNARLASAIDDYARANGVTDDLIEQLAPAAKGDTIMVITVAGHTPQRLGDGGAPPPHRVSAPSSMGRGGGFATRGQPPASYNDRAYVTDRSVFEVSASLFSVRQHHSVARVNMTYSGSSVDEALKKFTDKLGAELPGASCTGWKWDVPIDDERIRHLPEP